MSDQQTANQERKAPVAKKLSAAELSAFAGQLALIVNAGLSASEGLTIMYDDAQSDAERKILSAMKETMDQSGYLHEAMADCGVFPNYMVHMVETGEKTGNLDRVLTTLESHYQREQEVQTSIYRAVIYPIVLSIMVVAVILVLIVQIMPVFQQIFSEMGVAMTGLPLVLTQISQTLSGVGFVVIVVVLVVMIIILIAGKTSSGSSGLGKIGRILPGMRKSRHDEAACRFAGHMALVLKSGLTAEQGLEMAEEMIDDADFCKRMKVCRDYMDEGDSFAGALSKSGIFSGVYAQLIAVGAKTGNIDVSMERIADLYRDEIDTKTASRLAKLEPALIIILSVIIGGILLSVILPLLNIMSNI